MATLTIAAALFFGFQHQARAQATVIKGELTLPGELPFFTMPDDPFVVVLLEAVLDVRAAFDSNGGTHFLVKEVTEVLNATVIGTTYDYEFVSTQAKSPNNTVADGRFAGSVQQEIVLIRIDPDTALPIAMVSGEGMGHMTVDPEGNLISVIEKMEWTITPLP